MPDINLSKSEPTPRPVAAPSSTVPSSPDVAKVLPPLLLLFVVILLALVPLLRSTDRDSHTGHRTTPAPTITQCGTTPTTSGAAPGVHRPGTVRPGRPALKNPAAPKPPIAKAPTIRTR